MCCDWNLCSSDRAAGPCHVSSIFFVSLRFRCFGRIKTRSESNFTKNLNLKSICNLYFFSFFLLWDSPARSTTVLSFFFLFQNDEHHPFPSFPFSLSLSILFSLYSSLFLPTVFYSLSPCSFSYLSHLIHSF